MVIESTGLKNFETRIIGKLCETVSKIIQEILGDKISLLKAALIAIILAVGKFPDHKMFFWTFLLKTYR